MAQYVFGKRVGNRLSFAVEFEACATPRPRLWNEWYGYLWLWVEGLAVGNPTQYEMVMVDLGSLQASAVETGSRKSDFLSSSSSNEALEMVMWAVYGDDDPVKDKLVPQRESLEHFEIFPRRKTFFDGWEGVLVEEGGKERLIYRQEGKPVHEAVWPLGTFRDIVLEAMSEFEKLARFNFVGDRNAPTA